MPRPEKHVFVCTQSRPEVHPRGSCAAKGCGPVAETFFSEFQQRFLWGRFSVASSSCIGPCSLRPNVLVYPDGVLYNNVRAEDVSVIIEEHLIGGRPVERLRAPAGVW